MLFLVKGLLIEKHYLSRENEKTVTHPVEAETWQEAVAIFTEYFEAKSRPFDVTYYVRDVETFETLRKT